jgi:hypothetical protein
VCGGVGGDEYGSIGAEYKGSEERYRVKSLVSRLSKQVKYDREIREKGESNERR